MLFSLHYCIISFQYAVFFSKQHDFIPVCCFLFKTARFHSVMLFSFQNSMISFRYAVFFSKQYDSISSYCFIHRSAVSYYCPYFLYRLLVSYSASFRFLHNLHRLCCKLYSVLSVFGFRHDAS